jgi:simple sugar transport system substrate-binding protein
MNKIAVMLLEGKKLASGTDLGVPGYTQLRQDPEKPNLFYGSAWVDVTKENMDAYNF